MEIVVPGSKSLTQRALVAAALAQGRSEISGALWCEDSERLTEALKALGVTVDWEGDSVTVVGSGRLLRPDRPLNLGNAGTGVRFLTAAALLADGPVTIDGVEAMRRRPMPGLLQALRDIGAKVTCHGRPDCPPVTIEPPRRPVRRVVLDASGSSQQISALLLTGPALGGLDLSVVGRLVSMPYVDLTLDVMQAFSASVELAGPGRYLVSPKSYEPTCFQVEGDWSSASYPLAAGWLTGRAVRVPNVSVDSHQPDSVFPELLDRLSREGDLELDLAASPDIAPTVAVCALFRRGRTRLTGLGHLRIKESDRLEVLARGLRSVGARIQVLEDGWAIEPGSLSGPAVLDPAGDHRMAMCFGLLSLKVEGLTVGDPDCVRKSYPGFWSMLETFRPRRGLG